MSRSIASSASTASLASSRREFLGRAVVGGAALALSPFALSSLSGCGSTPTASPLAPARKRILILGGTGFLGPKTVEAALARGHSVTVFNRGKTEKFRPFGFEGVEHLYGNRDPDLPADDARAPDGTLLNPAARPKGLEQLAGREFDAVIDNSGYYPRHVKASAELLAQLAQQYLFISSISAYANNGVPGADESSAVATLADPTVETMGKGGEFYGGLKALCEQAAQAAFPGRAAIVRPGYIVGPGDGSDRFTYWPIRISRGGEAVAPGTPDDPLQWVDVRDLAEWLVKLVEDGTCGVFNSIGPTTKWGDVLAACVAAARAPAKLTWVDADFLTRQNAGGEDGLFPIWIEPKGDYAGFHRWSNARAVAAGARFRPIATTAQDLLAWFPSEIERRKRATQILVDEAKAKGQEAPKVGDPEQLRAGPPPAREAELLATWKQERVKPSGQPGK